MVKESLAESCGKNCKTLVPNKASRCWVGQQNHYKKSAAHIPSKLQAVTIALDHLGTNEQQRFA